MTDSEWAKALGLDPETVTLEQLEKEMYKRKLISPVPEVIDQRLIMNCDCCCWDCCFHNKGNYDL